MALLSLIIFFSFALFIICRKHNFSRHFLYTIDVQHTYLFTNMLINVDCVQHCPSYFILLYIPNTIIMLYIYNNIYIVLYNQPNLFIEVLNIIIIMLHKQLTSYFPLYIFLFYSIQSITMIRTRTEIKCMTIICLFFI